MFFRCAGINELFMKDHAFVGKTADDKIVHWPETVGRKFFCPHAILVTHQHQFIIQFLCDPGHVFKNMRIEYQLRKGIDLVSGREFLDQGPIAVNEQNLPSFFCHDYCLYCFNATISCAFCCAVPTVMRRLSSQSMILLRLRTMIPFCFRYSYMPVASFIRTSKKLASEGKTFSTMGNCTSSFTSRLRSF